MKKVNIAIVGATGMVGRTFLKVLSERHFPIDNLYLFSSAKSAGSIVEFNGKGYVVEELNENSFDRDIQICRVLGVTRGGHLGRDGRRYNGCCLLGRCLYGRCLFGSRFLRCCCLGRGLLGIGSHSNFNRC